jgi:hypothetical protein
MHLLQERSHHHACPGLLHNLIAQTLSAQLIPLELLVLVGAESYNFFFVILFLLSLTALIKKSNYGLS